MFVPFVVNADTCDTDKITIKNIDIESKSDNVEELDEATANGKNINLNLSMSEVGDNIKYKFVIKNDSNEDFELDKTSLNLSSDYINYLFETEDNSNVVKANSSKNVTLRVEYKTEVPEDKFESGSYSDNKTMTFQLSNGKTINVLDTFKNPNTGGQSYILILVVILMVSGTLYLLLKKKKYTKFMALIIVSTIFIPISVYALCKCNIAIDSNIKIMKKSPPQIFNYRIVDDEITITGYKKELAASDVNYEVIDKNKCENYFEELLLNIDYNYFDKYGEYNDELFNETSVKENASRICSGQKDKYTWTLDNYIYYEVIPSNDYVNAGLNNINIVPKNMITGDDVIIPDHILGLPVTIIDAWSFNGIKLNSVKLPNTLKIIYGGTEEGTFASCGLTHIEFPESLEIIGNNAFTDNELNEVIIPDNVTEIGATAFASNKISKLKLGKNVKEISFEAFKGNNITTLTIPSSVTSISPEVRAQFVWSRAFAGNPLTSVIIEGKNSADDFDIYRNANGTPFSWDPNVTCIKDNDENVENGCIIWKGNN